MKKFTKLFLSCAAVAAVATAVGVSAMAADITGDVTGTFNEETKAVTVAIADTPDANTQVTFLVFKGAADTDISADSVKGIDQGTTVQPTNSGLKSDVVAPETGQETYTVKVGYYKSGAFTVKSGTFKLGTPAGTEIKIGDIDLDGQVRAAKDATYVMWYGTDNSKAAYTGTAISATTSDGKNVTLIGDIDVDGQVRAAKDATYIMWYGTDNSKAAYTGETVLATGVPEKE